VDAHIEAVRAVSRAGYWSSEEPKVVELTNGCRAISER